MFCPLGRFVPGKFCPLGRFFPRDVLSAGRFVIGGFFLGRIDVLYVHCVVRGILFARQVFKQKTKDLITKSVPLKRLSLKCKQMEILPCTFLPIY